MFHSSSLNSKTNRLRERCLRMIYNDKQTNFEELLVRDNSVSLHYRNIQSLAIKMFMVATGNQIYDSKFSAKRKPLSLSLSYIAIHGTSSSQCLVVFRT